MKRLLVARDDTSDAPIVLDRAVALVRTIDAELLLQELRSDRRITILDVRSGAEFRGPTGKIAGARSLPMHQLIARVGELGCHRSEPVVVVSEDGVGSRFAAAELERAGFAEVKSLAGGMRHWLDLGFPVDHASTPPSAFDAERRAL